MNGILVVDKPSGFTSFDVVAKMRGICKQRKVGHGGTLDPMATGVLPIFLGNATKAMDLQPNQNKAYEAVLRLGLCTDTGDITGEVLCTEDAVFSADDFRKVLPAFLGEQEQVPPMYSAVKVAGKPLYKYAREGQTVDRKKRRITIYDLTYLGNPAQNEFSISVTCSKGTYIRTLAEDIGKALGTVATLAKLRRTEAGVFSIADTLTIAELQQASDNGELSQIIRPVSCLFANMQRLDLPQSALSRLLNGAPVYGQKVPAGLYSAYVEKAFIGIVDQGLDGVLQVHKLMPEEAALL